MGCRMSYKDFIKYFFKVEICNLGADLLTDDSPEKKKKRWEQTIYEGSWIKNVNAGGCMKYKGKVYLCYLHK